jgi:hypothetical protein
MHKLSTLWSHEILLSFTPTLRQMRRWSFYPQLPPLGPIEYSPLCSLWWQPLRQLQRMYGLQGHAKEVYPFSESYSILLPPSYNRPSTSSQESHMLKSPQKSSYYTNPAPVPPANQPQQQSNNISELKALLKKLFDQLGTLLHLLLTPPILSFGGWSLMKICHGNVILNRTCWS